MSPPQLAATADKMRQTAARPAEGFFACLTMTFRFWSSGQTSPARAGRRRRPRAPRQPPPYSTGRGTRRLRFLKCGGHAQEVFEPPPTVDRIVTNAFWPLLVSYASHATPYASDFTRHVGCSRAVRAFGPVSARGAEELAGLLRDAEAAARAGRLDDAAALYIRAHRDSPQDLDASRGACEVGLKLAGDAPISVATAQACHQAFLATQGPRGLAQQSCGAARGEAEAQSRHDRDHRR